MAPRDSIFSLLGPPSSTDYNVNLASMLSHFARSLIDKPGDESIMNTLVYMLKCCQRYSKSIRLPTNVVTDVAKVAFKSRNWDLFKEILINNTEISPDFFKWARNNLPSESELLSFKDIQDQ